MPVTRVGLKFKGLTTTEVFQDCSNDFTCCSPNPICNLTSSGLVPHNLSWSPTCQFSPLPGPWLNCSYTAHFIAWPCATNWLGTCGPAHMQREQSTGISGTMWSLERRELWRLLWATKPWGRAHCKMMHKLRHKVTLLCSVCLSTLASKLTLIIHLQSCIGLLRFLWMSQFLFLQMLWTSVFILLVYILTVNLWTVGNCAFRWG